MKELNLVSKISNSKSVYVIAEIGINHNGDLSLAKEMIDAAKDSGANCAKFQNFIADKYISKLAQKASYQKQQSVNNKSQHEIIKACELNREMTIELLDYAAKRDIDFMSTPFEVWSLRLLNELNVSAIKVSSCNLTNYPFLRELAESKRPVLLSTGMADLCEVVKAVEIFKKSNSPLMLFQCTSNYPSKIENANLRVIPAFNQLFDVPVGLSDHTTTNTTCIAAVALGAVAVEKHFTLSRDLPGIDQKASIEPKELSELVSSLNECRASLGSPLKTLTDEEIDTKNALRRSLAASRDIKAGEVITEDLIAIKRPGNGFTTDFIPFITGKTLKNNKSADELFLIDDF